MRTTGLERQATLGLLHRAASRSGFATPSGIQIVVSPNGMGGRKARKLFTDSLIQWLNEYDLRLYRKGALQSANTCLLTLENYTRSSVELQMYCHNMNYHVLADLLANSVGQRDWIQSCPTKLRQLLPAPPTETYPLLVGQYWLMGTSTADVKKETVIRIDGRINNKLIITKWTVKMVNKTCKRTHTHKQIVVPYDAVFPTESAIRVSSLKGPDKYYTHSDRRIVSRPQWSDDEQQNIPLYLMGSAIS